MNHREAAPKKELSYLEMRDEIKRYAELIRSYLVYPYSYSVKDDVIPRETDPAKYKFKMFRSNNLMVPMGYIELVKNDPEVKFTSEEREQLRFIHSTLRDLVKGENNEHVTERRSQEEMDTIKHLFEEAVKVLEGTIDRLNMAAG